MPFGTALCSCNNELEVAASMNDIYIEVSFSAKTGLLSRKFIKCTSQAMVVLHQNAEIVYSVTTGTTLC